MPIHFQLAGVRWESALRFAIARLVKLPPGSNTAYYHGITTSVRDPVHRKFWDFLRGKFKVHGVVTTNYDIMAEQGLHQSYSESRSKPIFYYGGLPFDLKVRKMLDVTKRKVEEVSLGKDVVLCKMHGSINWAFEPCGADKAEVLKIHDDVRAAVRSSPRFGRVAMIPPLPEKRMDPHFSTVWDAAAASLRSAQLWIVCGHALNLYDHALRDFFARAASESVGLRICVIDPCSESVAARWKELSPSSTRIDALPGIPHALDETLWFNIGL